MIPKSWTVLIMHGVMMDCNNNALNPVIMPLHNANFSKIKDGLDFIYGPWSPIPLIMAGCIISRFHDPSAETWTVLILHDEMMDCNNNAHNRGRALGRWCSILVNIRSVFIVHAYSILYKNKSGTHRDWVGYAGYATVKIYGIYILKNVPELWYKNKLIYNKIR